MSFRTLLAPALALAALALGGSASQAAYSYAVTESVGGTAATTASSSSASGLSTLTFTGRTDSGLVIPGSTQINATSISLTSTASDSTPDTLGTTTLTSTITITNNGQTGVLSYVYSFSGTASTNASNIFETFVSASMPVTIGGGVFSLGNFLNSAPTVNGAAGSISVTITSATAVPEPASLALVALGFCGVLGARRFRRHAA